MPPNRAALHSAHRLPDVLTIGDLFGANDNLVICGHDLARYRWRLAKNLGADPAQYRKRKYKYPDKDQPQLFHRNRSLAHVSSKTVCSRRIICKDSILGRFGYSVCALRHLARQQLGENH